MVNTHPVDHRPSIDPRDIFVVRYLSVGCLRILKKNLVIQEGNHELLATDQPVTYHIPQTGRDFLRILVGESCLSIIVEQ